MSSKFPKSVPESQKYITWAFPLLLGYGIAEIAHANWQGRVSLIIVMLIVFTGWSSFGVIPETAYNDVFLVVDLGLLATYWLLLFYSASIGLTLGTADLSLWNISGTVFVLYAVWDVVALADHDAKSDGTKRHLIRFTIICMLIAISCFVLGRVFAAWVPSRSSTSWVTPASRISLGVIWVGVLIWWHWGRFRAALSDNGGSGNVE